MQTMFLTKHEKSHEQYNFKLSPEILNEQSSWKSIILIQSYYLVPDSNQFFSKSFMLIWGSTIYNILQNLHNGQKNRLLKKHLMIFQESRSRSGIIAILKPRDKGIMLLRTLVVKTNISCSWRMLEFIEFTLPE